MTISGLYVRYVVITILRLNIVVSKLYNVFYLKLFSLNIYLFFQIAPVNICHPISVIATKIQTSDESCTWNDAKM